MFWDLHVLPHFKLPFSAGHATKAFLAQRAVGFHQWINDSAAVQPRTTKFMLPVLLLECIQIKQESVQCLL